MLLYYQDIVQLNRTPIIPADIIEGFMFYLAEQGVCSYGLGWYLFYYRSNKDPYSVNFTHDQLYELSENSTEYRYTADQIRQKIPSFLEVIRKYQYSQPVLDTSKAALRLLFILLDMTAVHYSTVLADSLD